MEVATFLNVETSSFRGWEVTLVGVGQFISATPLEITFGLLGSLFLLVATMLLAAFYYKNRLSRLFLYMSLAEFFLWLFITCLLVVNVASKEVPLEVLTLIYRVGSLSSRAGLLVWFIIFQLLGSSEQKASRHVLFGLIFILLGYSAGYSVATTRLEATKTNWSLTYDPLAVMLIVITYAWFVIFQMALYYHNFLKERRSHYKSLTYKSSPRSTLQEYVIIHGYFIAYFLAIITFVLARMTFILLPDETWIFFGGLSQFLLSMAVIKYPNALILGNLTFHEIGIYSSKDGLTVFHVSPQESSETDFLTVALRGMETVISRLIGAKKPMTTLGFGDRSIILYKINSQYLYAIVNEPNYIARDLIRALSNKWKKILNEMAVRSSLELPQNAKVQSFMRELQQFLS